jgi:phage replication initiation protein
MVDWLNLTFLASTTYRGCLSDEDVIVRLSADLHSVLGFGVVSKLPAGRMFYKESYVLGNGWGYVCIGGQNDTVLVTLSGTGCMAAKAGWESRLYDLVSNQDQTRGVVFDRPRITRIDLAADYFHGEYTPDKALEDYHAGLFSLGAHPPEVEQRGNWIRPSGRGRTLNVGCRQSGKMARIYEKGKQLAGDCGRLLPDWVRVEGEFHSKDREIPLDVLVRPGQYLAGMYPAFAFVDTNVQTRIKTKKNLAKLAYESAVSVARNQIGKLVNVMREIEGSADAVVSKLLREGIPRRLASISADYTLSPPLMSPTPQVSLDVAFHMACGGFG